MTDHDTIYQGLSHAAWGYFFLNFDFNINTVSILPRFVGVLLLLSASGKLSGERRDLALLRPLGVLLACWSGADWFLSWMGGSADGHILFLDLMVTAVTLYFHFQFLTDMAGLAERYKPEESDLDRRILRRRTAYTLLVTAIGLTGDLAGLYPAGWWSWGVGLLAAVTCVVALCIMSDLFRLCGLFGQEKDGPRLSGSGGPRRP